MAVDRSLNFGRCCLVSNWLPLTKCLTMMLISGSLKRNSSSVSEEQQLEKYRARFAATRTEEGQVMATMLAYVLQDRKTSGQREILADFRTSPQILQLFTEARSQQTSRRGVVAKTDVDTN